MKELDLHGRNRFEAELLVQSFLQEAYEERSGMVKIIYGSSGYVMHDVTIKELNKSSLIEEYSSGFDLNSKIITLKKKGNK